MADIQFHDANGNVYTARAADVGGGVLALLTLVATSPYVCDGNKTLSVTTASLALSTVSGGIPAAAKSVLVSVPPGGGDIYYTCDGSTAPTNGSGIYLPAGSVGELAVNTLANVKLIASAGTVIISLEFRHFANS